MIYAPGSAFFCAIEIRCDNHLYLVSHGRPPGDLDIPPLDGSVRYEPGGCSIVISVISTALPATLLFFLSLIDWLINYNKFFPIPFGFTCYRNFVWINK